MSRRHAAEKREVQPDAKFGDIVLTKFMNCLMLDGKKSAAEAIVYGALDKMVKKSGQEALTLFHTALDNVKPALEVRSRRVGGATYQVPMEVPVERQLALAMRWMVGNAAKRKGVPLQKALASEIKEAANGQGNSVKKRDDVHKMAQANRAFAHFRF